MGDTVLTPADLDRIEKRASESRDNGETLVTPALDPETVLALVALARSAVQPRPDKEGVLFAFDQVCSQIDDAGSLSTDGDVALVRRFIEQSSTPRWIPVGERLPERGAEVQFLYKGGTVGVGTLVSERPDFGEVHDPELLPFTHWMPLPPAP